MVEIYLIRLLSNNKDGTSINVHLLHGKIKKKRSQILDQFSKSKKYFTFLLFVLLILFYMYIIKLRT